MRALPLVVGLGFAPAGCTNPPGGDAGLAAANAPPPALLEPTVWLRHVLYGSPGSCRGPSDCASGFCLYGTCTGLALVDVLWMQDAMLERIGPQLHDAGRAAVVLQFAREVLPLDDIDPMSRARVLALVGLVRGPAAGDMLAALVADAGGAPPVIRRAAAAALARRGDLRALPFWLRLARATDPMLRALAADALGQLPAPAAIEALHAALTDEAWAVRSRAVEALAATRLPAAQPSLQQAAARCPPSERERVRRALGRLLAALQPNADVR